MDSTDVALGQANIAVLLPSQRYYWLVGQTNCASLSLGVNEGKEGLLLRRDLGKRSAGMCV